MSFAFVCHHNSFIVFNSIRRPSVRKWTKVAHASVGIAWVLSMIMATTGYFSFMSQVCFFQPSPSPSPCPSPASFSHTSPSPRSLQCTSYTSLPSLTTLLSPSPLHPQHHHHTITFYAFYTIILLFLFFLSLHDITHHHHHRNHIVPRHRQIY